MKNFGTVFNHDEREYSVYPEFEDGKIHIGSIDFYQKKGINVELSTTHGADIDAAMQEAEVINQKYHYHKVEDTLGRYLVQQ
jgi:hypothetical protein